MSERPLANILVELLVILLSANQSFFAPASCMLQPVLKQVEGIHGARIVDVVSRDKRSVQRPGSGSMEELPDKV